MQRQQYAVQLLALLHQGKTVYNIDESTVDTLSYQRRHWRPSNFPLTNAKPVRPTISLIACVGTDWSCLLSMTQTTTCHKVF